MHVTNSALQRYLRTDMRKLKGIYQKAGSPGCPERVSEANDSEAGRLRRVAAR